MPSAGTSHAIEIWCSSSRAAPEKRPSLGCPRRAPVRMAADVMHPMESSPLPPRRSNLAKLGEEAHTRRFVADASLTSRCLQAPTNLTFVNPHRPEQGPAVAFGCFISKVARQPASCSKESGGLPLCSTRVMDGHFT